MRILIITALQKEYLAVKKHLTDIKEVEVNDFIFEKGKAKSCKNAEVFIRESGSGNISSAISTENLTRAIKPDLTMFIGIAGSIKDLNIGDILIAEKVYGYQRGKSGENFLARPELGKSTKKILERAKAEAKKSDWVNELEISFPTENKVLVGNIASGDIVLISKDDNNEFYNIIKSHYNDTHAIEMEGIGFMEGYYHYNDGECIVLRGISDYADPNKNNKNEDANQEKACNYVAGFGFYLIKKYVESKLNKKKTFNKPVNLLLVSLLVAVMVGFVLNYSNKTKTIEGRTNNKNEVIQSDKDTIKEKIKQSNTINISGNNNKINDISMENKSK